MIQHLRQYNLEDPQLLKASFSFINDQKNISEASLINKNQTYVHTLKIVKYAGKNAFKNLKYA